MKKLYEASADTGRDFVTFFFYSEHRARSKANKADAVSEYRKKHGHGVRIIDTRRSSEE